MKNYSLNSLVFMPIRDQIKIADFVFAGTDWMSLAMPGGAKLIRRLSDMNYKK
jgi:hypothetical protein